MADKRRSFWKDNSSFGLTLVYLYLSGLGAIHSWTFYQAFGVNFFRYAGPGDYLTAAFADILDLLIGVAALVAAFGLAQGIQWIERKCRRWFKPNEAPIHAKVSPTANVLQTLIVLLLAGLPYYSWDRGEARAKSIRAASPAVEAHLTEDDKPKKVTVLGDVGPFTFFYEPSTVRVIVVPTSNVLSMEFSSAGK